MTVLRRTQEISLILCNLLHGDYDCTKLCIKTLKDTEMNESRNYHIDRHNYYKHSLFSSYSFLYILKGAPMRNKQQQKMDNAKKIYNLPAELSDIGLYLDSNGHYHPTKTNMIDKYDELLASPNLTTEQKNVILNMKEKRKDKIKNLILNNIVI
jgi:hypothetical protein